MSDPKVVSISENVAHNPARDCITCAILAACSGVTLENLLYAAVEIMSEYITKNPAPDYSEVAEAKMLLSLVAKNGSEIHSAKLQVAIETITIVSKMLALAK